MSLGIRRFGSILFCFWTSTYQVS